MAYRLYVCRHGERIDHTFGVDWIGKYFLGDGQVNRFDINIPNSLPARKSVQDYVKDTPLTNIGLYQATLTGTALKDAGVTFSHVFSSPALRCVQTGANILKAMNLGGKLSISVEPGLFERFDPTYGSERPTWFSPQELRNLGYNINTDYKPLMMAKEVLDLVEETYEELYNRAYKITSTILDSLEGRTNILFIAHGGSLDSCTRQLNGRPPRADTDMHQYVPYCGVLTLVLEQDGSKRVEPPPFPALRHFGTVRDLPFDWQVFADQS